MFICCIYWKLLAYNINQCWICIFPLKLLMHGEVQISVESFKICWICLDVDAKPNVLFVVFDSCSELTGSVVEEYFITFTSFVYAKWPWKYSYNRITPDKIRLDGLDLGSFKVTRKYIHNRVGSWNILKNKKQTHTVTGTFSSVKSRSVQKL